jgi:hypothetical protein
MGTGGTKARVRVYIQAVRRRAAELPSSPKSDLRIIQASATRSVKPVNLADYPRVWWTRGQGQRRAPGVGWRGYNNPSSPMGRQRAWPACGQQLRLRASLHLAPGALSPRATRLAIDPRTQLPRASCWREPSQRDPCEAMQLLKLPGQARRWLPARRDGDRQ